MRLLIKNYKVNHIYKKSMKLYIKKYAFSYLTRSKRQSSIPVWYSLCFSWLCGLQIGSLPPRICTWLSDMLKQIGRIRLRSSKFGISIKLKKRFTREINHTVWSLLADALKEDRELETFQRPLVEVQRHVIKVWCAVSQRDGCDLPK